MGMYTIEFLKEGTTGRWWSQGGVTYTEAGLEHETQKLVAAGIPFRVPELTLPLILSAP